MGTFMDLTVTTTTEFPCTESKRAAIAARFVLSSAS